MIALPYVGAAAAKRELDRPVPDGSKAARGGAGSLVHDPLRDTGLRVTYRTVSVMRAIAEHPGASNKQIGTAAGIGDQGQISKLLARLERLGLIAKGKSTKGGPNAWSLTEAGERVARTIRAHTGTSAHTGGKGVAS
jgi:DNA-binding MarR family transcriptional regulator